MRLFHCPGWWNPHSWSWCRSFRMRFWLFFENHIFSTGQRSRVKNMTGLFIASQGWLKFYHWLIWFDLIGEQLRYFGSLKELFTSNPPTPHKTHQTHQIELLMLSGPQSSEHKCQQDYQPRWRSNTLTWRACSEERNQEKDSHKKHIHTGRRRRRKRVSLVTTRTRK